MDDAPEGVVSKFELYTRRNIKTIIGWMKETREAFVGQKAEIEFLRNKVTAIEELMQIQSEQLRNALQQLDKQASADHPSDYANNDPATRKQA